MTTLFPFQKNGVAWLEYFDGQALLGDEMGLGKTIQALFYAAQNKKDTLPMVVVCPANVKYNWEREAFQHVGLRSEVLEGRNPSRRRRLTKPRSITIVNYDILGNWRHYLYSIEPKLVVFDEIHYLSNPDNQRSKYSRWLAKRVYRVIGLSGTAMEKNPSDLWHPIKLIRPDLFPSFRNFAERYCRPRLRPWGWEYKGVRNAPELHRILKEEMLIRRRKRKVMKQLPRKSRHIVLLQLHNRAEYDEAFKNFRRWLQRTHGKRSRNRAIERLTQGGYLKRLTAKLKMKSVIEWVDAFLVESDRKLVIGAIHKSIIRELMERYGNLAIKVDGSVTKRKRQKAIDAFQEDKHIRILVGNLQAAGVGINLTAADTTATIEFGWKPSEHSQFEARIDRIGQRAARTQHFYLVAHNTIELRICKLIQERQETVNAVLDGGGYEEEMDLFDQLEKEILRCPATKH